MRIGSFELKDRVFAAPMAGVTDRPFRKLCRRLGAAYAVSEMVASDPRVRASGKTSRRLDHEGESAPVAVQLVGADPAVMADAARYNVDRGAQIIDLNMGCPARKVCQVACGSALLKDEALVARIVQSVVEAVDVPVTLKYRTGWDTNDRNAVRIARMAEAAGIRMLTLHGRTRACGFTGRAEYDTIARVKREDAAEPDGGLFLPGMRVAITRARGQIEGSVVASIEVLMKTEETQAMLGVDIHE